MSDITIPLQRIENLVWDWARAQRDALDPNEYTITGLPNPKSKKKREAEASVALALREAIQTLVGADPYFVLSKHLGAENGYASHTELITFFNGRDVKKTLTQVILRKADIR